MTGITKIRILFICTGNSCRSQMAEGYLHRLRGDEFEVFSAGIQADGLNPRTVTVMNEVGIDISSHTSNTLDEYLDEQFDYVITLCGHADEYCPSFPAETVKLHRGFEDPYVLARSADVESEKLKHYRRIRDEIAHFIEHLTEFLLQKS